MRTLLKILLVLVIATSLPLGLFARAHADTFNPNNIIYDAVFDNANSMSAGQINNWLNANFPSSCISTNNGFSAPDPIGYNPSQGFLYGGNVSAGQVISDAAQAYGINPQVLLATLQKESSVVSGDASYHCQYINTAMGYGCPDSGSCPTNPATMSGFSKQVIHAAWLFKFGEQRSEGNAGWAVVKGNWNNSDDPPTCYGGPMTQGTLTRGCGQASTYYDGYTSIDGSAVHMDDGATAALYWYTPHFSGNQHFFTIFTNWFGSTVSVQPVGGALYSQQSTGKVYLVTDSVRYYIPNWDVMTDYGLDRYYPIPASDTTISQFSDGGNLTNLVWDGSGVYLVNNGVRYHVSSGMCSAWGFSCFDNTVVKGLGSAFQTQYLQTGWELTQLNAHSGVIYEMSGGQRLPIANPQTLSDLGLSNTSVLFTSNLNAGQPLGSLLLTTPVVVSFPPNPTIYYFDGSSYYAAPSMSSYNDWGLGNKTQLAAPTSSYNTTPPSSQTLSPWYIDSGSNKYIIDSGRRVLIPSSMQSLWQSKTFVNQPQNLANSLPQTTLQQYIWSNGVFKLSNGSRHYVPTWNDYLALGITDSTTTNLQQDKVSDIPQGNDALGDGIVVALQSDNQGLYVVNKGQITRIPDPNTFNTYGFSWNDILVYSNSILTDYPLAASSLSSAQATDGTYFVVGNGAMYKMSPAMAADFGANNSSFQSITNQTARNSRALILSRFIYNTDNGRIYYASGGALHYIATYSAFVAYGGNRSPMSTLNNAAINLFTEAQPVY